MWGSCITNGILTLSCIIPLYQRAVSLALSFVGLVSLFLIIAAGITFITSGGGKQVETAKNMLTYAIIGLVIVLLAIFIINLIAGITGVTCILSFGFSNCR